MAENGNKNGNVLAKIGVALVPVALVALVTAAIVNSRTLAVQYKALEFQHSETARQGREIERLQERVRVLELEMARVRR